jgi:hypothetical protein
MPKFTIHQVIEALRAHHGLLTLTADTLQCNRQTLYNYAQRYPAVAEAIAEERERLIDLAEQGLYEHLQERAPWAIALVLKTLGRRRGYEDKPSLSNTPDTGEAQEWQVIQTTLFKALQAYPEARWAVVQALGEPTGESTNGHLPSRMVKKLESGFSEELACLLTSSLAPRTEKLHPVVHLCGCEVRYQAQQTTHILPHRVLLLPSEDYAGM